MDERMKFIQKNIEQLTDNLKHINEELKIEKDSEKIKSLENLNDAFSLELEKQILNARILSNGPTEELIREYADLDARIASRKSIDENVETVEKKESTEEKNETVEEQNNYNLSSKIIKSDVTGKEINISSFSIYAKAALIYEHTGTIVTADDPVVDNQIAKPMNAFIEYLQKSVSKEELISKYGDNWQAKVAELYIQGYKECVNNQINEIVKDIDEKKEEANKDVSETEDKTEVKSEEKVESVSKTDISTKEEETPAIEMTSTPSKAKADASIETMQISVEEYNKLKNKVKKQSEKIKKQNIKQKELTTKINEKDNEIKELQEQIDDKNVEINKLKDDITVSQPKEITNHNIQFTNEEKAKILQAANVYFHYGENKEDPYVLEVADGDVMKDVAHKLIICRQLGIPAVATFGGKAFNNNDYEKESDMMKNYNEYIDTGDYDEYLRNKRSLNSDAKTM